MFLDDVKIREIESAGSIIQRQFSIQPLNFLSKLMI